MFDALKRLIGGRQSEVEWPEVAEWAKRRDLNFKRVREDTGGFVLDGQFDGRPWRLEWGPPQRPYIEGHELRIRMDLGLSPNLQMLVLTQPLFEALERAAFESFTESTQTVIDGNTPEEMRWLVMYPKVVLSGSKALRTRYHCTGGNPEETIQWLEGALSQQLESAGTGFLQHQPPFVLMTLRGRVYLRMALPDPDLFALGGALALFQVAVQRAVAVNDQPVGADELEESADDVWGQGDSTAWQPLGLKDGDPH